MRRALRPLAPALLGRTLPALLALSAVACSDGAVRLARCIERAARELEAAREGAARRQCDLEVRGSSTVVAFPAGPVSSKRLTEAGLSPEEIETTDLLVSDFGPHERLNVLPKSPGVRPSFTSYQRRFVSIPDLLVCRAPGSRVQIVLRKEGGRVTLARIESR